MKYNALDDDNFIQRCSKEIFQLEGKDIMTNMLSIITPAYNAGKFIDQMIESVLAQPIQIELIIVNDGSLDDTKEVCEKYSNIYKNIKLINTQNHGAGSARNTGLKYAGGGYIAYLDSDDLLLSCVFDDAFMQYLKDSLTHKVDIISTARTKIDMNLLDEPRITFPQKASEIMGHIPELEFWTCIYRRDFLVENRINFFEYREQDIETAFRYRAFSKAQKIDVLPYYSFYLQRNNPASNMHTFNHYKLYRVKAEVYNILSKEAENNVSDIPYLESVVVENIFKYFKHSVRNGHENINDWVEKALNLKNIFCECKLKIRNTKLDDWKIVLKLAYYALYLRVFFSHENSIRHLPASQSKKTQLNDSVIKIDSNKEISNRLIRVSDICRKKFRQI